MEKYKNKYRIASARLSSWDYSNSAAYFITICTYNRIHFFGEIINHKMQYSEIGNIAHLEWLNTFAIRKDMNLQMGEFIIMPNHMHAIVVIGKNKFNDGTNAMHVRDAMHCVSNMHGVSNQFGPQSKNLASIVRGYKSSVTTYARKNKINDFKWQSRYHDHIIRNDESFQKISNYIINNPTNWKEDKLNNTNNE